MTPQELEKDCQDLATKIVIALHENPTKTGEYRTRLVETFMDFYNMGAGDAVADPKTITNIKSVLLSKTYWGLAIGAFGQLAPHLGLHIGTEQTTQYASQAVSAVGTLFAAYGRYKAFKQLT